MSQNGYVQQVSAHLDEVEVSSVQVFVQAIVVKLKHAQLRELVNGDAAMIGSSALFDLECTMNFLQVLEERRPEGLINLVFVGCESCSL